jgi:hypothetical protein
MKQFVTRAWARVKLTVRTFATWEPAKWRGMWVAVVGFATTLGYGQVVGEWDAKVQAAITAASVLVPYLQALWIRQSVSPGIRVEALEKALTAATGRHAVAEPPHMPGTVGVDQPYPHQP